MLTLRRAAVAVAMSAFIFSVTQAQAAEAMQIESIHYAPATEVAGEALTLNGAARVRLGLLRDVSGESFIEALDDGLKANLTPEKEKAVAKELDELRTLMKQIGDVKVNDLVDFDYVPEKGTMVNLNGKAVGQTIGGGRALYNAVLAIWLGDKTIDNTLKTGMMGR